VYAFIRLECQAGIDEEEVTDLKLVARTRDWPRRHYLRPVSGMFIYSGPRTSTLCSPERNQLSVTGYYARSIPCFDCCFQTRSFALTTWPG